MLRSALVKLHWVPKAFWGLQGLFEIFWNSLEFETICSLKISLDPGTTLENLDPKFWEGRFCLVEERQSLQNPVDSNSRRPIRFLKWFSLTEFWLQIAEARNSNQIQVLDATVWTPFRNAKLDAKIGADSSIHWRLSKAWSPSILQMVKLNLLNCNFCALNLKWFILRFKLFYMLNGNSSSRQPGKLESAIRWFGVHLDSFGFELNRSIELFDWNVCKAEVIADSVARISIWKSPLRISIEVL